MPIAITSVILAGLLVACSAAEPAGKPLVVTSIYPMQYFSERIGGDRVTVENLVPPGVEAHAFELTPGDLLRTEAAAVVAMNGLEMEPWLERAIEALGDDFEGCFDFPFNFRDEIGRCSKFLR